MIKQLTNFFFQKNIEIIAQNLYFDKINQRENDDYQAKNFELSRFLGNFVIYIPNNSENLWVMLSLLKKFQFQKIHIYLL